MPASFDRTMNTLCARIALLVVLLSSAVVLGVAVSGCRKSDSFAAGQSGKQRYHCPMHPTYVADKPGDCPICGMKLVLIKGDNATAKPAVPAVDAKTAHIKAGQFYCLMHTE